MAKSVDIDNLEVAIANILKGYGDVIYKATEQGLSAGENVLITNLKASSPAGITKEYAKSWKGKGKKYKMKRYVGNTKSVKSKKNETIPLSNILEYSTKSKHQGLIKRTYESSIGEIADAIVSEIKKEV